MGADVIGQRIEVQKAQKPLLYGVDLAWMLALMALGLALRLIYFSGFGLADDQIFRGNIAFILNNRTFTGDNISYRTAWLVPAALFCKIFGLTELGMIVPITATAILGIGLIYSFGKALWGRQGALIAALLLIVHPLDFAWSTMFTIDIPLSFFSALSILLVLRAIQHEDAVWKCRFWLLAGVSLWLAFQAKISAVLLAPAIALICWTNRRRLGHQFFDFLATASVLFGVTLLVYYLFTGDLFAPYHAELRYQGLAGPEAPAHVLTADRFWTFGRLLFFPDRWGNFLFSLYPHLLVALAAASWFLGIRTSPEAFWWFAFVFLGMQFNIQRAEGVWITGFRNIRHGHIFIYPVILLLTGYLVELRVRSSGVWAKLWYGLMSALLVFSAWQSVAAASKTEIAFADRRNVCRVLATMPQKVIYSDGAIYTWCAIFEEKGRAWQFRELHTFDKQQRKAEIAAITSGYLVTGGAREPIYGGVDGIPRADEILDRHKWRLLKEFPGPEKPTPWRPEPLRLWEVKEVTGDGGGTG
jgi:hypothetical protein